MATQAQQQKVEKLPRVNYLAVPADDYVYESKPLPKRVVEDLARGQQSGGMASQFEAVTSSLNNGV